MVEVEVEYAYEAEQSDELSIKVGDVLSNVVMSEGGWWEGELNGKKGMFPDNFVKVRKKEEKEPKKKDVQATKRQSVKDLANKLKLGPHNETPMIRKKDSGAKKKRAKVVFSYEPEQEDELKLELGEVLDIIKQEEEGWWEGQLNGRQGMFPSNFVEIIEDSAETSETPDTKIENTEEHLIKGKKVQGIGLGNIFGDGPIKLRKTGEKKPMDKPQEPPKAEKREEPAQRKPKETKPVERAVVRYSYTAEHEDELSLTEGEVISVLDKELEDSGWWRGEVHGKVGVFPDNFVDIIKEEPSDKGPKPLITPAPQPKPKKPPPPSQPASSKPGPPKLPDKAPVVEQQKHETEKDEKRSQPALPSKKPSLPPPLLSKKPVKPADTVLEPSKEETKEEPKHAFEAVESSADKLTHLTATRPKGPTKRPPSQVLFQNDDVIERNGEVPGSKEERPQVGGRPAQAHASSKPMEPPVTMAATAHLQSAIDELRREMQDLRSNTVSKTMYNELKSENDQLKQDLDSVKTQYSRRFRDIMSEVDEEKKIRLATQVEMERIRKLVSESHV
ncbi:SH3 domain-containing kinase-binding protein 1-like isoform X2 [Mya arenaria]|uniref:SH3 domain-containing kinase-binding protein 1-like isoform X2 n=1 Tax=Mya arenaria TaxID=6604 RepID=UPI0022E5C30C|nr:SH3 domain-containing kinase-binding protein 1-like isoform X2 [Mya arenaria]